MSEQLVTKITAVIGNMSWPQNPEPTMQGRHTFMIGLEALDGYRGEAKVLSAALRTFQTGDSLPYAYGGVAYTLVVAARERDGSYAETGLNEAMKWLEQAQDAAPDILEINVLEAVIYTYLGRYDDARLVLDYLQGHDPNNFQLLKAEVAYWQRQDDVEEAVNWFNKAAKAADNVPQRLRLRAQLGDYYMQQEMLDEALVVYKEAIHFDRDNPQLWHKVSVIYWHLDDMKEAELANQYTLRLNKEHTAALRLRDALKKKRADTSRLGRLFR